MTLTYDWSKVKQLVEVRREPLVCFRIVPDRTITNYNNYKFFKDIAELEKAKNLKEALATVGRFTGKLISGKRPEGFKIVYKTATDYVWYEIVIKEESINFYVICSKSNESFVRLKLEQCFPHAPIDVADIEDTHIPEEDTIIADLKLQRHNFFSIHTDYSEQAQPIEDVLMNAEDVRGGDILKLSMRVQPYDQNYWSYKAEEWEKRTRKGKAPKRLRVTKDGILGGIFGFTEISFQKFGELFRTFHEVVFKNQNIKQQIVIEHASQETREVGDISRQTSYKMTAPVFRAALRVASHSENETRRRMNLKSMSNSFIDVKDTNNSIVRTKIYEKPTAEKEGMLTQLSKQLPSLQINVKGKSQGIEGKVWDWAYKEVSEHKITPLSWLDLDYTVMCDKELGKLQMLPTMEVQKRFDGRMDKLDKREIGIPEAFLKNDGIHIGKATYKGNEYDIHIPDKNADEFPLPLVVSGIQGSGKDTFAVNWIVENALRGRGAVVPDVIDERDRGMADALIRCLPPEKLLVLDFANEEYSPYLDWTEAVNTSSRFAQNKFASELVKFFNAEDEAGIQTERYLREAAKALPNGSIINMGMLFISQGLRDEVIKNCEERGDMSTAAFWRTFSAEGEGRQRQIASPILNRLHKLIGDPTLKPIFGQTPTGKINFYTALQEGKVIICKIPKVAFSTSGIKVLVNWISVKTWLTKQVMAHNGDKCESIMVWNEPHQIMDKSLEENWKELYPEVRKYGLQLVSLFHDFSQIPKDLSDIMIASGANFILLKQRSDKAWLKFKQRIESEYSIADCMNIKKWDAMVGFMVNGVDQPVLHVRMNAMPYERGREEYDNAEFVKECLRTYGTPVKEIESEILEMEKVLMSSSKKK